MHKYASRTTNEHLSTLVARINLFRICQNNEFDIVVFEILEPDALLSFRLQIKSRGSSILLILQESGITQAIIYTCTWL